jgi:folate-binding Fe-S cluster repair protein YgfZ
MQSITATGKDALAFLHAQSSNNIKSLEDNTGVYSAFLSPQAKIIDLAYVFRLSPTEYYILSCDPEKLVKHLIKHLIIDELEINTINNPELSAKIPSLSFESFREDQTLINLDDEHKAQILPKYVSFTKGCFPGQEPLAKFQNIGKPKRKERANANVDEALLLYARAQDTASPEVTQAIDLLKTALREDPSNETALETLGVVYARQGRYQEAISIMQELSALNPNNQMALMNLSIFYMKLGVKETAEQYKAKSTVLEFQKALEK